MKIKNKHYIIFFIIPLWVFLLLLLFPHSISYWLLYWWIFPVALTIAMIVNTIGISGSALFVPFFILLFPILSQPLQASQSIMVSLITESFGLSSSAVAFWWFNLIDKKIGLRTIIIATPFVIFGSVISSFFSDNTLNLIVAISLIFSVFLLINKKRNKSKIDCISCKHIGKKHVHTYADNVSITDKNNKTYIYCRSCGQKKRMLGYSIGGILQGSSGFGIGELGILSMSITNIPIRIAIGTSHIIVAFTAIIASITHVIILNQTNILIPWNIVILTVPAVIIGGQIAPYISTKLKTSFLELFVILLFSILSILLLIISFY